MANLVLVLYIFIYICILVCAQGCKLLYMHVWRLYMYIYIYYIYISLKQYIWPLNAHFLHSCIVFHVYLLLHICKCIFYCTLLVLPLHLFKLQPSDLVEHCLHLHQQCLVTASLDGLLKVTGAKSSCNGLLWVVNTYGNSSFTRTRLRYPSNNCLVYQHSIYNLSQSTIFSAKSNVASKGTQTG